MPDKSFPIKVLWVLWKLACLPNPPSTYAQLYTPYNCIALAECLSVQISVKFKIFSSVTVVVLIIGRFCGEPTDLWKVSTFEWLICVSQHPQQLVPYATHNPQVKNGSLVHHVTTQLRHSLVVQEKSWIYPCRIFCLDHQKELLILANFTCDLVNKCIMPSSPREAYRAI